MSNIEAEKPKKRGIFESPLPLILIVLVALFLIFVLSGNDQGNKPAERQVGNSEQPAAIKPEAISVTSAQLIKDYKDNEVRADETYKGKIIRVSGSVSDIGKDITDDPYVKFSEGEYSLSGVQCMFAKDNELDLVNVSKGQELTLEGKVSGYAIASVIVRNCVIVDSPKAD